MADVPPSRCSRRHLLDRALEGDLPVLKRVVLIGGRGDKTGDRYHDWDY
jgi:hypothetical protein